MQLTANGRAGSTVTITIVLILLTARVAAAQTVNAEELTRDTEGFALELGGSFAFQRGNTNLVDVGASGHAQYQTLHEDLHPDDDVPPFVHQRTFLRASARYQTDTDASIVNQSFAHARWTAMWLRRVGSEVFLQHQFNEFQRLQTRLLGGTGARVLPLHHRHLRVAVGTGVMGEFESIAPQTAGERSDASFGLRWTSFLNLRLAAFDDRLVVRNVSYVQPRLDDFSDLRLLDELDVTVAVNETFALGTSLTVAHDSQPPTGIDSTDVSLRQSFKLSF